MAPRDVRPWNKKHAPQSAAPAPITQTSGPRRVPDPRCASNPCYCDHNIRIPRWAYELAMGMRKRLIEKSTGDMVDNFTPRVGIGRMVGNALKEYAERHDLMPKSTGGAT